MECTYILIPLLKKTTYDVSQKMKKKKKKTIMRIPITSKLPWGSLSEYFSLKNASTSIEHYSLTNITWEMIK